MVTINYRWKNKTIIFNSKKNKTNLTNKSKNNSCKSYKAMHHGFQWKQLKITIVFGWNFRSVNLYFSTVIEMQRWTHVDTDADTHETCRCMKQVADLAVWWSLGLNLCRFASLTGWRSTAPDWTNHFSRHTPTLHLLVIIKRRFV